MNLKHWSLAAFALALIAPLSASALGLSILNTSSTGGDPNVLQPGDVLTVNLRLDNPGAVTVFGLGLRAFGYDRGAQGFASDNPLVYVGGASSDQVLSPVPGFGGIINELGTSQVQQGSSSPFDPNPTLRVLMFNGITTTASANGSGDLDIGVGGTEVGSGDAHFQLQFVAQGLAGLAGNYSIEFGVGGSEAAIGDGGVELPFENTSLTVFVVPEPGTALLMGLGLAGLATQRRR